MAKRVAIIDDEQDFLTLMEILFVEQGYEVGVCSDGKAAMDYISGFKPNLVFLDIRMTGMSGWEILRRLKSDPELCNIQVIITSAATDEIDAAQPEVKMQSCDVLLKPFDIDEAVKKARRCIGPPF